MQLPGSGGTLASLPCVTRNQGPENSRICRRTRGGRGRDTEARRDMRQSNLAGADKDLGAVRGRQRGLSHHHGKWWQTHARGVGRTDDRRRLEGGRVGRRPGGRSFAPGEELGSWWGKIGPQLWTYTDGDEVGKRRKQKIQKTVEEKGWSGGIVY